MSADASKVTTNGVLNRAQKLRLGGLLGFIVLMPVLAVPAVNQRLDDWLFSSSSERLADRLARVRQLPDDSATVAKGVLRRSQDSTVETGALETGTVETGTLEFGELEDWPTGRPLARQGAAGVSRLPPAEGGVSEAAFDSLQARLRELGASYYRLEDRREAGGATPLYRFRCEVPLPGNENYLRPFEADDRDPARAMQLVVEEIEVWLARHRLAAAPGVAR